ncbi:MAG: hypothetical protein ACRDHD_05025 [Candidatus Limnocylindria bacterium]
MTIRRVTTFRERLVYVCGALVAATVGFASVSALAASAAPRPELCMRGQAGAPVVAEFQIPDGRSLRHHIPLLGVAPELDAMAGPLTVVVFEGEHKAVPAYTGCNRWEPIAHRLSLLTWSAL